MKHKTVKRSFAAGLFFLLSSAFVTTSLAQDGSRVESPKNSPFFNSPSKDSVAEMYSPDKGNSRTARPNAEKVSTKLSQIYRVGVGDVLYISIKQAPRSASYFTVLHDGTIDFPLLSAPVSVAGLTETELAEVITEKVTLFPDPDVSVSIRSFVSHTIKVAGSVDKPGTIVLKREAVPLFVIKAEALAQEGSNSVMIRRSGGTIETIDLTGSNADNNLIFTGDILEFKKDRVGEAGFYFLAGKVRSPGRKVLIKGTTLLQAILESEGTLKPNIKKAFMLRRGTDGTVSRIELDIKSILKGKSPDVELTDADIIEFSN